MQATSEVWISSATIPYIDTR